MSNTSKGRAKKGSKFWMQTIVNSKMKESLDNKIGLGDITWISPLKVENYAEYRLNQQYSISKLGTKKSDFVFWPSKQPQWDAIGKINETIILVEAKAHTTEVISKISATSLDSILKIEGAMNTAYNKYAASGAIFDSWENEYYQLGNRLTFLYNLHERGYDVKLILLNIVNDPTFITEDIAIWTQHYNHVFNKMLGKDKPPKDVIIVYFEV